MNRHALKDIWEVFKQAGSGFLKYKIPKLSASLAYYTIFSLGPMLIVIIYLAELFWKKQAIEGRLYRQISQITGDKAAAQIQEIINSTAVSGDSAFTATAGVITLIIAATTVFAEIQDSINSIWNLKVIPKKGWLRMIKNRLLSFSLVVSLGFLLLVSLIINTVVEALMDRLKVSFPETTVILVYVVNLILTLLITSFLFAIVFKVLPDAIIRWKDVAVGAIFTAVLFMLGKFGITLYISSTDVGSAYGTAGSLVILIIWVYFSSIILYFGAEFTKCYAVKFGSDIQPDEYAVIVQTVQVKTDKKSIRENEQDIENTQKSLQQAKDQLDHELEAARKAEH